MWNFNTWVFTHAILSTLTCGLYEYLYFAETIWFNYLSMLLWHTNHINTLRPRQNGRLFADDTFKRIFVNENIRILIGISQKFFPKGPINNIPALVQIMAWRRPGDKPLFEPILVCLPTHICVTRPQWVNKWGPLRLMTRSRDILVLRNVILKFSNQC